MMVDSEFVCFWCTGYRYYHSFTTYILCCILLLWSSRTVMPENIFESQMVLFSRYKYISRYIVTFHTGSGSGE